jgi:hypothetical protein
MTLNHEDWEKVHPSYRDDAKQAIAEGADEKETYKLVFNTMASACWRFQIAQEGVIEALKIDLRELLAKLRK